MAQTAMLRCAQLIEGVSRCVQNSRVSLSSQWLVRACSSRGWHRARHERLRPEREEVRAASPYAAIENEPALKLIVDPPLPEALAQGVVRIQYSTGWRTCTSYRRFGAGALNGRASAVQRRPTVVVVGGRE